MRGEAHKLERGGDQRNDGAHAGRASGVKEDSLAGPGRGAVEVSAGLRPLVNRGGDGRFELPGDGWFQLAPLGEFGHGDSGRVQVIDEAAVREMVKRFGESAEGRGEADPGGGGRSASRGMLLVDYDHFSYREDRPSEAAGWITALEGRADGLWGQIRWTPEGEAALKNGRYRYLSPVWLPRDVLPLEGNRFRPLRLDSAGLTNNPNLRGIAPLSNRERNGEAGGGSRKLEAGESGLGNRPALAGGKLGNEERKSMNGLMQELGLTADAADEAAVAAVQALKNRAVSAETRATELEQSNRRLLDGQVEADLEKYKDRIKPEAREKVKAQLLANRTGTIELLEAMTEPEIRAREDASACADTADRRPPMDVCPPGVLHNRATARTPGGGVLGGVDERAGKQRAEVLSYRNRVGCSFEQAWRAVRAEKPELFAASE